MKRTLGLFLFLSIYFNTFSQKLYYQDVFYGGVTGGGFSSGVGDGASGQIIVNIDPASTIKKAYLFCNRYGDALPVNVTLNSNVYTFDLSSQVTNNFLTFLSINDTINCALHAIDMTNDIVPTQNTYNISFPNQITNLFNKYGAFYLVILYENPALPKTAVSVIINETNATPNVNYQFNNLLPIDTLNPVGIAIHSDIIWDTIQDGSNIFINGNNIGLIGGSDAINNIWTGAGVKGHFYYENNTLFGLDDDTPDSLMSGTDGLADIKSYIQNQTSSFNMFISTQSLLNQYNIYLAHFLSYTTPCDTFATTATTNIDTICAGENVQLTATGGSQYSWYSPFSTFNDSTLANPVASPTQTTTYIVTITNDSGCVKTEHVKIWVNPLPEPDTIIITNNVCGDSSGVVNVGNISSGNSPFTYKLTNLQTNSSEFQVSSLFDSLVAGNYEIQIIDNNGCVWKDTVTITQTNNVVANFTANPSSGVAPLDVSFNNTSAGVNNFEWTITNNNGDTLHWIPTCVGNTSNCGFSYTFDSSGTYQVCLVAYNNLPQCADTLCKTIIIDSALVMDSVNNLMLFIPNVFTPNVDGSNDNFVIQVQGANLLESLKVEIFNRWGQLIVSNQFSVDSFNQTPSTNNQQQLTIWDGRTTTGTKVPEGTYFYVISYETMAGEIESKKGSLSLLR